MDANAAPSAATVRKRAYADKRHSTWPKVIASTGVVYPDPDVMAFRIPPGRILRGALALMGILFLPIAVWFLWSSWRRYGLNALALLFVSVLFLWLANDHRPDSWLSALEDSGGPANPDVRDD